jgi:hypothetical protein
MSRSYRGAPSGAPSVSEPACVAPDVSVELSGEDIRDICLIVDAALCIDPIIRNVSDADTRALGKTMAAMSVVEERTHRRLSAADARDLANVVMAMSVLGVECFPGLAEQQITDDRVDALSDIVWFAAFLGG